MAASESISAYQGTHTALVPINRLVRSEQDAETLATDLHRLAIQNPELLQNLGALPSSVFLDELIDQNDPHSKDFAREYVESAVTGNTVSPLNRMVYAAKRRDMSVGGLGVWHPTAVVKMPGKGGLLSVRGLMRGFVGQENFATARYADRIYIETLADLYRGLGQIVRGCRLIPEEGVVDIPFAVEQADDTEFSHKARIALAFEKGGFKSNQVNTVIFDLEDPQTGESPAYVHDQQVYSLGHLPNKA